MTIMPDITPAKAHKHGSRITNIGTLMIAAFAFILHIATASRYGIFRDELYYIACARHLDFGYVDHPPFIAIVAWCVIHTVGTSLLALRFLPACAAGLLVWMTAQIARELGGQRRAQWLAALAILPVPIYLVLDHWLTMNAFEPLFWMGMIWAALRLVSRQQPRYWITIGVLVGLGLENKYSMFFPVVMLLAGLSLTPERRLFRSRHFALAIGIALLLFLPNVFWLVRHGFPFLEFERNSRADPSRIIRSPLQFIGDQLAMMNPVLSPLWLSGLAWLLLARQSKPFRFAGLLAFFVGCLLLVLHSKNYYLAPIYPLLFAAGSVGLENATKRRFEWISPAYGSLAILSGIVLAPLVMPLLPIPTFLAYQQSWHGFTPVRFESHANNTLPQYFSDEFGWESMVEETGGIYSRLPPDERHKTAVFANDYGQAAAIDFFGAKFGLPASISGSETFWLWGPRNYDGSTVIILGSDGRGDRQFFSTVESVGKVTDPNARADEHFQVFLCRGIRGNLRILWPEVKRW